VTLARDTSTSDQPRQFPPQPATGAALRATCSPAWQGWQSTVKRLIDVVASALILVLLLPILALVAVAIKLDSRGPVIFRQTRTGKGGREFAFLKFRTMVRDAEALKMALVSQNEADGPIFKIRSDPRLTRVGRILRRTSIDELPQIWNVLRGEMSLVGPRPPVPSEVAKYEAWQQDRLLVPGGISGLWQVSGRSELTFNQMVLLDLHYIEHWTLGLDFRILMRTVSAVVSRRGAY
jgi:exopolysaccharide biosynthesis polyprenyl glycosylphosphotransferase